MAVTGNYASYVGIKSVAVAAVFAAVYAPLSLYFIWRSIKNPVFSLIMTSVFCTIRVTAFAIRAYIASNTSAQEDQTLVMVAVIIYGVGFFGLLNSVYNLQIERVQGSGRSHNNLISKITGNEFLVHLALIAAVALSIIGTVDVNSTNASNVPRGKTFRLVSAIVFVAVTGILVLRCLFHLRDGSGYGGKYLKDDTVGEKNGHQILFLIASVFMVREVFLVIAVNNSTLSTNEALFYGLEVAPELVGVLLLTIPGLVPPKNYGEMIPTYDQGEGLLMGRR